MTQTVHPGMIPDAALKGVTTIPDFDDILGAGGIAEGDQAAATATPDAIFGLL